MKKEAKHDLDYYSQVARETISSYESRDKLYSDIDNAYSCKTEIPKELRDLPWIGERRFATTAAADAINAATRTFAKKLPQFDIAPLSEEDEERDRCELQETAMAWDFERQNMQRTKDTHWRIVESAMKYCAVALQTEYFPYSLKGKKDPRTKALLASRKFNWTVHHPGTVYTRSSGRFGLECVVKACVYSAQQILDEFGKDNPGVKKMLKIVGDDPADLHQTYFSFYDYTDWDDRVIWVAENGGSDSLNRGAPVGPELMREGRVENFIPWVVVDYEDPILRPIFESGLYENVTVMRTIRFSKAIDQAAHPNLWIQTPDGTLRMVNQDNTNPSQPIVSGPGVNVTELRGNVIDPQLADMERGGEEEMFRSTVAQILASVEKYAGANTFSTVNAMLQAAEQQLALSQKAAERAEMLATYQNFQWIKFSEIPLVAYRTQTSPTQARGEEISISPDDFDLEYLYLSVQLKSATISDETMRTNNAVNKVERLGMAEEIAWDELGQEGYALNRMKKAEDILFQATIQAKAQSILNQPQLELAQGQAQIQLQSQQAQMQLQQQALQQPQQTAPENTPNQAASPAFQQGVDTRGGGTTAAVPGMGREQING